MIDYNLGFLIIARFLTTISNFKYLLTSINNRVYSLTKLNIVGEALRGDPELNRKANR